MYIRHKVAQVHVNNGMQVALDWCREELTEFEDATTTGERFDAILDLLGAVIILGILTSYTLNDRGIENELKAWAQSQTSRGRFLTEKHMFAILALIEAATDRRTIEVLTEALVKRQNGLKSKDTPFFPAEYVAEFTRRKGGRK
jgi:hypothetical protein